MTELHPKEVIVPVLGRDSVDADVRLLGTGSIIGDGLILLTADHVVGGCAGGLFITTVPNDRLEVEIDPKDPKPVWPIEVAERDTRHDLALLRIDGYRPNDPLPLWFDFPLHENRTVLTTEYPGRARSNSTKSSHATRAHHWHVEEGRKTRPWQDTMHLKCRFRLYTVQAVRP